MFRSDNRCFVRDASSTKEIGICQFGRDVGTNVPYDARAPVQTVGHLVSTVGTSNPLVYKLRVHEGLGSCPAIKRGTCELDDRRM